MTQSHQNITFTFIMGSDFHASVRELHRKGGKYQNAAKTVMSVVGNAKVDASVTADEVFRGLSVTNHGESRIPHAVKYDLTGFARLVTVQNNGLCIFLFAGEHETCDHWIEKNRGLLFSVKETNGRQVLDTVRISPDGVNGPVQIDGETDLGDKPLIELLSKRYSDMILDGLHEELVIDIRAMESVSTEDDLMRVSLRSPDRNQQDALFDVLMSLRSGDVMNAKTRIDIYKNSIRLVEDVAPEELVSIGSSDAAVLLKDVDPQLFQHFVETATFERWMLYLHPAQRQFVDRDFTGAARMSGVSGSGKTCVVVHRALRLADRYKGEKVLLVTLSPALAGLINRLVDSDRGATRPANLVVWSIFDLCFDLLMEFEPARRDYYTKQTIAKNVHAPSEHVDEIWQEYFHCQNNNQDADVLFDVIQTLNARGIYANDYLRQEFDFIRSTFPPDSREGYLRMERVGRIVPLEEKLRRQVLKGLEGWERKMAAVGVIDDLGIIAALHNHLDKITPRYRAILVDEVQDLGTLELKVLRRLVFPADNDLFLSGDAAQTIYTKSADFRQAGIELGNRSVRLNQNYRNSREILDAAHTVLTLALEQMPKGANSNIEVIEPEYANFSSPKPLLLKAPGRLEEISMAIAFLKEYAEARPTNQRQCLVLCGYSQTGIENLGKQLGLPVLSANSNLGTDRLFLSDLEQTKGFEFDAVAVINCSAEVMPHPDLPPEESFRDLCRLYVAMTRAKSQLVVSACGPVSPFVAAARDFFLEDDFESYAEPSGVEGLELPPPNLPPVGIAEVWGSAGRAFLRTRDAARLDRVVQDEILSHVTGAERILVSRGRKQTEWRTFGSFALAMESPRARNQVISEEAWSALEAHLQLLRRTSASSLKQ